MLGVLKRKGSSCHSSFPSVSCKKENLISFTMNGFYDPRRKKIHQTKVTFEANVPQKTH